MLPEYIHVQWEGPVELDAFFARPVDDRRDYGVYQVYGRHPVYGLRALLYVGKAAEQTFATRLRQERWDIWAASEGDVEIFVGRLSGGATPDDATWSRQIDVVERLLVLAHTPARNAAGIAGLSRERDSEIKNIHVLNWGHYGSLLPEVSGVRWGWEFSDLPDYGAYGSHEREMRVVEQSDA